jgi:multimeric flavodoxin WrbA
LTKVILLSGSPREKSNTMDVLNICAQEIEKKGVEAEIISLR